MPWHVPTMLILSKCRATPWRGPEDSNHRKPTPYTIPILIHSNQHMLPFSSKKLNLMDILSHPGVPFENIIPLQFVIVQINCTLQYYSQTR